MTAKVLVRYSRRDLSTTGEVWFEPPVYWDNTLGFRLGRDKPQIMEIVTHVHTALSLIGDCVQKNRAFLKAAKSLNKGT